MTQHVKVRRQKIQISIEGERKIGRSIRSRVKVLVDEIHAKELYLQEIDRAIHRLYNELSAVRKVCPHKQLRVLPDSRNHPHLHQSICEHCGRLFPEPSAISACAE